MEDLEKYRKEIRIIDIKILELLEKRANLAIKIGVIKKILNLNVYQPQLEKTIIDNLKSKSKVLDPVSIEAIWKEIIRSSKKFQRI